MEKSVDQRESGGPRHRAFAVGAVAALAVALLAACSSSPSSSPSPPSAAPTNGPGGAPPVWLCRPGQPGDPCTADLDATVFHADGTTSTQPASPAPDPPIDCFYVYPTVSGQPTVNANLTVDPEETAVAMAQASRFSTACRVYAPMYPQLTLAAITPGSSAPATAAAATVAYDGVLSAWRYYLAHYNRGRGVVFIGHSQGSGMLIQLLRSQVDPNPAVRARLVSALLLGGNVTVPVGKTMGGDFRHIPACTRSGETGCVVAYSMFLDPPPPDSLFGRVDQGVSRLSGGSARPGLQVLCTNPASIARPAATGVLQPYAPTSRFPGALGAAYPEVPSAPTPWAPTPTCTPAVARARAGRPGCRSTASRPRGTPASR